MAISTNQPRGLLSRPMQVHVPGLGMESTTTRMQQCGWDFSADQDVHRMSISVVARHRPARLYFASHMAYDYYRAFEDPSYPSTQILVLNSVHNAMTPPLVDAAQFANHSPVDMIPRYVDTPVTSVEDLAIFAAPLVRTNEIIVEEREVSDLLADIIAKQEDGRQEHFKKMLRQNREGMTNPEMPQLKFHAQILSVA